MFLNTFFQSQFFPVNIYPSLYSFLTIDLKVSAKNAYSAFSVMYYVKKGSITYVKNVYLYSTLQNHSMYCPQKNCNYIQQIYCILQLICFCLVSHSESTWRKSISTSKDFSWNALNTLLQAFSYPFQNAACKAYMYNSQHLIVIEW